MRILRCNRCGNVVAFTAHRCSGWGAALGYVDGEQAIRVLTPIAEATSDRITYDEPLGFVHRQIAVHTQRVRFHGLH